MADVFELDGSTLDLAAADALAVRFRERLGACPTLTMTRRGIEVPPEASDTWMGKTLTWEHDSTLYFSGVIRSRVPRRDPIAGNVIDYQALGIRDLADKFPFTDKTTGLGASAFNCHPEDLVNYRADRAGRTVGEILEDVLTSLTNATNLDAYGLGNYTSLSPPTLPSATTTDLAALTVIPPQPAYVVGERFGSAIDGFLQKHAPNVRLWVQPDGTLRFLDLTTFAANDSTLTMGDDPIEPTEISRDVGDCWQRVVFRGAPIAIMFLFKLSQGTLEEDFTWGSYGTNAAAKAAWSPEDFKGTAQTQDTGTCTMSSTTSVTVTSDDAARFWSSNYWDQTSSGAKGTINLFDSVATGVTTCWTSPIVANAALSAGGTATVTLSVAAPTTSYDTYTITGQTADASVVWRKYKIADSTLWDLIVGQSTYPQPFVNGGGGATLTSTPIGCVFWPQSGSSPPYNMFPLPFQIFPSDGNIVFTAPTYFVANNAEPADVWALIPINTGPNTVASPPDSGGPVFDGDSNTIEGLEDTLVVTMADWRDPGQLADVQAYADDLLLSVKDGIREASIVHHGFYEDALTFGMSLNIAGLNEDGTTRTTGWESAKIPVTEVEIEWSQGADDYITTIGVSSRRGHLSAEMFLRPESHFTPFGLAEGSDVISLGGSTRGINFSDLSPGAEGLAGFRGQVSDAIGGMSSQVSEGLGGMRSGVSEGLSAVTPHDTTPEVGDLWLGTKGKHPDRIPQQGESS